MINIKKITVTLMMLLFCCLISACGSQEKEAGVSGDAAAKAREDGYKLSPIYGSALSEEELKIWQAAQDDEISGLTPFTILAERSGEEISSLFLCRDMMNTGLDGWYITDIRSDESGKVISCTPQVFDIWIDTYGFYDTPKIPENKGWKIRIPSNTDLIVKDMYGIFQIAAKHVEKEISYVPVVLLAEQLVAGTNYKYLCTDKSGSNLYILDIYEDMNSGAKITGTGYVDLTPYEGK